MIKMMNVFFCIVIYMNITIKYKYIYIYTDIHIFDIMNMIFSLYHNENDLLNKQRKNLIYNISCI